MSQIISDYYANLQYDEEERLEKEVNAKLHKLSSNITFIKSDNFSKRLLETAIIIEKNLSLFQYICNHVDTVNTVIEYLKYYGMKFAIDKLDKFEEEEEVMALISTICNTCLEYDVDIKDFLLTKLLENSSLTKKQISYGSNHCEIVIFEDSDIDAVIRVLGTFNFTIIWIQEPLAKILSRINESLHHLIRIFRSKKELIDYTYSEFYSYDIISIWSEDIIAVKDLAASLNRNIIFINTFMDIYGGIILLPYSKESNTLYTLKEESENTVTAETSASYDKYNLFYDGMWQKPVKNTYWVNKDHLWASATRNDIEKCINTMYISAKKGAKIWSAKSIDSRIQVLSKLAFTLQCNNEHKLADIISKWIKSSLYYENSIMCPQSGRLEITIKRKPRGIVILKAKSLDMLFWQLILALITGNSVIVLCNSIYCSIAPYCDMFSTSGVPPGVINMLSFEIDNPVENVESILQQHHTLETLYHIDETELSKKNKENPYINFTKPKTIILPIK